MVDYWSGYEKNYFLKTLNEALSDTSAVDTKVARCKATPNVKDAVSLGRLSSASDDFKAAVEYYKTAQQMNTDNTRDYTFEIFENTVSGLRDSSFTKGDIIRTADAVLASANKTPQDVVETAHIILEIDKQDGKIDKAQPYLEAALDASNVKSDENLSRAHDELMVDYYLFVKQDSDAAISQKKANMPEGWEKDAGDLNEFAWWCFENKVNLKEAESLARKAVNLAEPGETKAMILDTAAEICFARGNKVDAIKFAKTAIEQAPNNKYYAKQLKKFEGGGVDK